jgi:hypothetical protein
MSDNRAQSFYAAPPPQMIELAEAGNILSWNICLAVKRKLMNSM